MIDIKQPVAQTGRLECGAFSLTRADLPPSRCLTETLSGLLGGENEIQVGRDVINPNNSSTALRTHTHIAHVPLLAIIQHTLHNSNNL